MITLRLVETGTPLRGWRYVGGKLCARLIEGATDRQRTRRINKQAHQVSCGAHVAGRILAEGEHPCCSPIRSRQRLAEDIETARELIELMEAARDYLATLPEPDPRTIEELLDQIK